MSIDSATQKIGKLFTRKMAAAVNAPPPSSPGPWPNSEDDYELRDVIGMYDYILSDQ